jgi:hypothetical protein
MLTPEGIEAPDDRTVVFRTGSPSRAAPPLRHQIRLDRQGRRHGRIPRDGLHTAPAPTSSPTSGPTAPAPSCSATTPTGRTASRSSLPRAVGRADPITRATAIAGARPTSSSPPTPPRCRSSSPPPASPCPRPRARSDVRGDDGRPAALRRPPRPRGAQARRRPRRHGGPRGAGLRHPGNDNPVPPTSPLAAEPEPRARDLERARALLAEAGHATGWKWISGPAPPTSFPACSPWSRPTRRWRPRRASPSTSRRRRPTASGTTST